MFSGRTAGGRGKLLPHSFIPGGLSIMALVALYQSYRAHRAVRELHTPGDLPLPGTAPHVSIILPVRNEEINIDACLESLLAQDYPNFNIMVIDDGSTDATPWLLERWRGRDPRIMVRRIDELPPDWAGKPHALHMGATLTGGEWMLFTDADTRHAPQTLRLMVGYALDRKADLLTMYTNLMDMSGTAMPLLMPLSEVILAHRVTPDEISDPAHPRAFAFGQYILLRRKAYIETGGYAASYMRTTFIDDLALAEQFKQAGKRVELVNGRGLISNRQWTTWKSARQGWGKSCYSEIIRSRVPFGGLHAGLALIIYGLGPLCTLLYALISRVMSGKIQPGRDQPGPSISPPGKGRRKMSRLTTLLASITLLAQIDAKRCFDREHGLPVTWSLTAPLSWAVFGVMVLDVARLILTGHGAQWKGRQIHIHERTLSPIKPTVAEVARQAPGAVSTRIDIVQAPGAVPNGV
ncbi:MAG TPA: glycosyltransferase family 2 protein [Ktedonobacteraceae bacterium]|jgi:chlorobactene glucosyltransferase|nr:glycosyltransferase family 2 protein [Ktedonobacteraceae bacterium]